MKKIRIMSVFGTRPEAIKMCPLVKVIEQDGRCEGVVCVTAQHREMLDQVLEVFSVRPDYDLNVMQPRQTLAGITTRILTELEPVLAAAKPDLVLVHGDTTTSFATALAAFYHQIPVGHVEAGLRTGDRYSPFPEEMNRTLTGRLATLHFAPTEQNRRNLEQEHVTDPIFVTGNTVLDAFSTTVRAGYEFHNAALRDIRGDLAGRFVLMTAHRRENLGAPLQHICRATLRLAEAFPELRVVYPVHPNPAVSEPVHAILGGHPRIHLLEPLDVTDLHNLMASCFFVLTDSGGLQEEGPSFGKPVLVLRTETERPEAVAAGCVEVVGVEEADIVRAASRLLTDSGYYESFRRNPNPYGDGNASRRIVDAVCDWFQGK